MCFSRGCWLIFGLSFGEGLGNATGCCRLFLERLMLLLLVKSSDSQELANLRLGVPEI